MSFAEVRPFSKDLKIRWKVLASRVNEVWGSGSPTKEDDWDIIFRRASLSIQAEIKDNFEIDV